MKAMLIVSELEDYTISVANGAADYMHVILCVPKRNYSHLLSCFDARVDVRLLDWPRHRSLKNIGFIHNLWQLARCDRPDVIHLLSNNTLWLNLLVPFWRRTPLLTTVHDIAAHPGDRDTRILPKWATDFSARRADHLVVHGECLRSFAIERFDRDPQCVHVLPHPVIRRYADLATSRGLTRKVHDTFNVTMFGRVYAYKGLESLIRAEAILNSRVPNLKITIAGRGDDPWRLQHLMGDPTRYDIRSRFIADAEVAQIFLDSDLVALPYIEASQSGVLAIAAAFGKPVIATDVGELGRTVEDGRLGLVVPPADPVSLAEAIARLASQPEELRSLGRAAQAWSRGPVSYSTVGKLTASLYKALSSEQVQDASCVREPGHAQRTSSDAA